MGELQDLFIVKVTSDHLKAELEINEEKIHLVNDMPLTYEKIQQFLKEKQLAYGIIEARVKEIVEQFSPDIFPMTIAKGVDKIDGKDGEITYQYDMNTDVDRSSGWNFRDVMRIPTVEVGEKIASIVPPTRGEQGMSVYGKKIAPRPGKPALLKPGKNVTFREEDKSFYAQAEGQITLKNNRIHVYTVYDIPESITMKVGNVDFPGSVIIRGDVPSGFTVKATGDIKIFGLVEAATIIAEGSVYVSEGIAGLKEGLIQAGEDVHIGYVNQGNIRAGNQIIVENSILHSECVANNDIICKRGNIIGGSLSAGLTITAKDVGNRLNTHTYLSFGVDREIYEEQQALVQKVDSISEHLEKMYLLQNKLKSNKDEQSGKHRITMLKLRHSIEKLKEQLTESEEQLEMKNAMLGSIREAQLIVKGKLYPNVSISFGKYQRTIDREHDYVLISMDNNDIVLQTYHG